MRSRRRRPGARPCSTRGVRADELGSFGMWCSSRAPRLRAERIEDSGAERAQPPGLAFIMLLLMFLPRGVPPTVVLREALGAPGGARGRRVWLAVVAVAVALVGRSILRHRQAHYFDEPQDVARSEFRVPVTSGAPPRRQTRCHAQDHSASAATGFPDDARRAPCPRTSLLREGGGERGDGEAGRAWRAAQRAGRSDPAGGSMSNDRHCGHNEPHSGRAIRYLQSNQGLTVSTKSGMWSPGFRRACASRRRRAS